MPIEVVNNSTYSCKEGSLVSVAQFAMSKLSLHQDCELAITIVDLDEMASLNLQWMGESGATDVLAFPMDELVPGASEPGLIGDIVLSPQYAERGATEAGHSLDQELQLLTVHGLLHLLGYDHRDEREAEAMFALQGEILREWRSQP
jgi:probable rRNA maturation factor